MRFSSTRKPLLIAVLADDHFYSPATLREPDYVRDAEEKDRFEHFTTRVDNSQKTGLGSSAAIVTAIVGALLTWFLGRASEMGKSAGEIAAEMEKLRGRQIYNLAQIAHVRAQGKVGSGFDVASALFGSIKYRRFSESLLDDLGEIGSKGFPGRLKALVEKEWDQEIEKLHPPMPKGLGLAMLDVKCGSKTPGMVKQVLKWKSEEPNRASAIWALLQALIDCLRKLLSAEQADKHTVNELKITIRHMRENIRQMSRRSGVPIEPPEQTELIDACCKIDGVVGGVVPGAGGYDAVALLIETTHEEEVVEQLHALTSSWKFGSEGGKVRLMPIGEDVDGGLQLEDYAHAQYKKWKVMLT